MTNKILILSGIAAALIYLGADILAGKLIQGYSFSAHSMSDLPAIGSPTRGLALILSLIAGLFMSAFVAGIWKTADGALFPRLVGWLLLGNVILGLVGQMFFPNRIGVQPAFGTPGVMLMFFSVLCFVLAMVMGAFAFGGWMRVISIVIPSVYILLAVIRFATSGSGAAETANSLMGVQERTMVYSFLSWVAGLAVYLLQR